jgi:hypothetical protein
MINFVYYKALDNNLKTIFKIILLILFAGVCKISVAQPVFNILPVSEKLFLNPSFAGLDKKTRMNTGLQFYSLSKKEHDHIYFMTYDSYSEKLRGGYAIYLFQGLSGKSNINNTGIGITFSKPVTIQSSGKIIPSFNINYLIASSQWFVYATDKFIAQNQNNNIFLRHSTLLPNAGILYDGHSFRTGLSSYVPLQNIFYYRNKKFKLLPINFIFHYAKNITGTLGGLMSEPYKATPELSALFSEKTFLTCAGMRIELPDHIFGIFTQNNFTQQIHGISALAGWKINNLRINFSSGFSYSLPGKKAAFHGEATIGFMIPPATHEENDPWRPSKKTLYGL